MIPEERLLTEFGNHVWQSTAFLAAAALATLSLRSNHARVRYWLWLAASAKFLVPFSAIAVIAGRLGEWLIPAAPSTPRAVAVAEQVAQVFAPVGRAAPLLGAASAQAQPAPWAALVFGIWCCGFAAALWHWGKSWRKVATVVRASQPVTDRRVSEALRRLHAMGCGPRSIQIVSSRSTLEPGVFGIFRPVLWLPEGIAHRFSDDELEAVLAHELCHARRRDNLAAAMHSAVNAMFWFHPLVWWLRTRLISERETVCDEEVVRLGCEPQAYAEGILKVCEFYAAQPLTCAAGITGGGLRKRIEAIMASRLLRELGLSKKILLAVAAFAAFAFPVTFGVLHARTQASSTSDGATARATFDVVSVKVDQSGELGGAGDRFPRNGRWRWRRIGLGTLVQYAYNVSQQQVIGIPKSMDVHGAMFNIEARMPPDTTPARFRLMLQSLLAERFHFAMHRESREIPVISIELAKGGSKLQKPTGECLQHPTQELPQQYQCGEIVTIPQVSGQEITWQYVGRSVSMADLVSTLSGNGPVFDDTGVQGLFDLDVKYRGPLTRSTDDPEERLNKQVEFERIVRDAFEKQAGLIVDLGMRKKHPMPVIVIDHAEMPTAN